MNIVIHQEDIPADIIPLLGSEIAIDTETMGLNLNRDRLCLVQLKGINDERVHLIQFSTNKYSAPNLGKILTDENILKVYHYARFDVATILKFLGALSTNNYCTKIASFLARTYSNKHGLKELCQELLNVNLNKQQQSSYWGNAILSPEQQHYAASDVLYLTQLREKLNIILDKEKRMPLAQSCFSFISSRALLDVLGWNDIDIFSHSIA
ncbi:ribonuclease D [Rickettsiales bacterium LUAb2]